MTRSFLWTSSLLEVSRSLAVTRTVAPDPAWNSASPACGGDGVAVAWEPVDMGQARLAVQAIRAHFLEGSLCLLAKVLELRQLETAPVVIMHGSAM